MDWQIISHSEIGASHLRQGKPNQDAIKHRQVDARAMLVAADGHGSAKYRHSDKGAQMAVETALNVLERFAINLAEATPKTIKENFGRLPRELVRSWRETVDASDPSAAADGYTAYGATLLAVLLTARYALYVQLGDGDLLILDADGEVRRPLPKTAGMIANETHSLCQEQAADLFQSAIQFFDNALPPKLVFLATDGYANSFVNETEFQRAVNDFYTELNRHGVEKVQACLPGWLKETSAQGSGDDVTVGILLRTSAFSGMESIVLPNIQDYENEVHGSKNIDASEPYRGDEGEALLSPTEAPKESSAERPADNDRPNDANTAATDP